MLIGSLLTGRAVTKTIPNNRSARFGGGSKVKLDQLLLETRKLVLDMTLKHLITVREHMDVFTRYGRTPLAEVSDDSDYSITKDDSSMEEEEVVMD